MKIFVIAQALGILGMAINVFSFQAKKQRTIILMQLFGSALFAANMLMIGAVTGGILNTIGIFRAFVYSNKDKIKNLKIWNIIFITLFVLSYFLAFFVAEKEANILNITVEILPVLAMIATTVSFAKTKAASVRKLGLVSSPLWLVYNIINLSIGGILCEVFNLISIVTAILRLYLHKSTDGV